MDEPVIVYPGNPLSLAVSRKEMIPVYHRWISDSETIRGFGNRFPPTLDRYEMRWDHPQRDTHSFELVTADSTPVGMVRFDNDDVVRTAEYHLIIAPEARGNGYAAMATRLALDYAFGVAGRQCVWLQALEPNASAISAYEKAGFKRAGVIRRGGYWGHRPCDLIYMDALPND
ncbi:RimJ/RimL family protein N-acetyltransferase [Nocardiopsis mwathae]|uniref:RimJ/RimL family protein N-acetyltransferase n=2 Tax=Nocardiopsis mwathae TaxID=1472723 RepID=A0A7W9YHJ3_9ACTN|nr:RimJ/RimL family protein N-acetyltransferase [Nocardiopsis mwathae]